MQRFGHACVSHHDFAIIEHVVADQRMEKIHQLSVEQVAMLFGNSRQVFERFGQTVADLHVFATQLV